MQPPARSSWLVIPLTIVLIVLLIAGYAAAMRLSLDVSRLSDSRTADERDRVYLAIHSGAILLAFGFGFAWGRWSRRGGLAMGLLAAVVLIVAMFALQAGSFAYACNGGENDLIRHWQC